MIASQLHERSRPALTTFDQSLPEERAAVREIVKDPFVLDFLAADPRGRVGRGRRLSVSRLRLRS
jgi:predicted nuclease of restriction endonuclease-like (RecB) superfamily